MELATALTQMGHPISADTARKELVKLRFSRQSNCKARPKFVKQSASRRLRY
jgi:hypothetical protein